MSSVITRTAFCPECEKSHRPWKGIRFLCYGAHRDGYYVREALGSGVSGYTPHIFILEKVGTDGRCTVASVCSMHGCSVEYRHSNADRAMVYGIIPDRWETVTMTIADWNALRRYRRDPQYAV